MKVLDWLRGTYILPTRRPRTVTSRLCWPMENEATSLGLVREGKGLKHVAVGQVFATNKTICGH